MESAKLSSARLMTGARSVSFGLLAAAVAAALAGPQLASAQQTAEEVIV